MAYYLTGVCKILYLCTRRLQMDLIEYLRDSRYLINLSELERQCGLKEYTISNCVRGCACKGFNKNKSIILAFLKSKHISLEIWCNWKHSSSGNKGSSPLISADLHDKQIIGAMRLEFCCSRIAGWFIIGTSLNIHT